MTATVTVRLPNALAEVANGAREFTLAWVDGITLGVALDHVAGVAPGVERRVRDERGEIRRYVNVFVDDDECRALDGVRTPVPPGATIWIIPSVAGGSPNGTVDGACCTEGAHRPHHAMDSATLADHAIT